MRILLDIRFWVALSLVLRLWHITDPPLETSHHWRQTLVTMVARNMVEVEFDLMHPRMDTAGDLTGITGMEFPLLNALVAICLKVFGPAHWYGRLIVLLVSTIGILAFHRLLKRRCNDRVAFHASVLLLFSLWFMYGRKIMPDVFALSLVLIGVERCDAALHDGLRWRPLFLGAVVIGAGVLSKLSAGCLLAAWPAIVLGACGSVRTRAVALCSVGAACIPALWWYFHWVPYLVEAYGYWHFFMGSPIAQGALELWANPVRVLDNFYFDAMRFSGFALVLAGCWTVVRHRQRGVLFISALIALAFFLFMLKSGRNFWWHAYYVLPFIPVMALLGGHALAALRSTRWSIALLAIVVVENVANQANDFRLNPDQASLLQLEADLDVTGDAQALIAVNSGEYPTPMYFAHRKGWGLVNGQLARPGTLDSLAALGCAHVVVMKHTYDGDVVLPWPVLLERDAYRIHGRP